MLYQILSYLHRLTQAIQSSLCILISNQLVRLENRTIESVQTAIPSDLTEGLEIKEFEELNGLIVTGTRNQISILS